SDRDSISRCMPRFAERRETPDFAEHRWAIIQVSLFVSGLAALLLLQSRLEFPWRRHWLAPAHSGHRRIGAQFPNALSPDPAPRRPGHFRSQQELAVPAAHPAVAKS